MRTAIGSALCIFGLLICCSYPAAAQSASSSPQLPETLLHRLSLPGELPGLQFPALQKKAESPARELSSNSSQEPIRIKDKKDLQDWLRQHIDPALLESSSECGHIIIYVPPVTDTKMIIKVPQDAADGRTTPGVRACGEDLRRVDAPRRAPPATPNGSGVVVPLRSVSMPK
jgi:hypothetical protein